MAPIKEVARCGWPQQSQRKEPDFKRGFIRAQTVAFDDYVACGSEQAAKKGGKLCAKRKEYVVQDGGVLNFLFNG